jgi:hypothetical protein
MAVSDGLDSDGILDDDEEFTDFETMNSDNELERKMARELYDEVCVTLLLS